MEYLRHIMAKRKDKPVNATRTRARAASKRTSKAKPVKKAGTRKKRIRGPEPPQKPFDERKWFGAFPDMAEWYIESLREEARLNEEKADRLAKAMLQRSKGKAGRRAKKTEPGVIDVDRFFGAMPHLKGDAVKVQRRMRDEW